MSEPQQVSLYFCQGSSDKEYHAQLEAKDDGFVVNFQYGRRGGTLKAGTKTAKPVAYVAALEVYEGLVKEKMAKGYSPGEAGAAFQGTSQAGEFTGVLPQLLNPIGEEELERYLSDPAYGLQEKHDGERVEIDVLPAGVGGINRKGLCRPLPLEIAVALEAMCRMAGVNDVLLDGELVGNHFHVFDIRRLDGKELESQSYIERWETAERLCTQVDNNLVSIVDLALATTNKRALMEKIRARNGEGVVFKRLDAPYTPGRPNSGGSQLKHKFYESATCVVGAINGDRRSVALTLYDEAGHPHDVGNVTIPPNQDVPPAGSLIEVRYLYAYEGGSLYQPIYLGPRTDMDEGACLVSQLKYKATPPPPGAMRPRM